MINDSSARMTIPDNDPAYLKRSDNSGRCFFAEALSAFIVLSSESHHTLIRQLIYVF